MSNIACRAAWAPSRSSRVALCRAIAGRPPPEATRCFRSPSQLRASSNDPGDAAKPSWNHIKDPLDISQADDIPSSRPDEVIDNTDAPVDPVPEAQEEASPSYTEGNPEKSTKVKDKGSYGSALRRAGRNTRSVQELPPVTLPAWFLERNVTLFEGQRWIQGVRQLRIFAPKRADSNVDKLLGRDAAQPGAEKSEVKTSSDSTASPDSSKPSARSDYIDFDINGDLMLEILTMVSAGLQLPAVRHVDSYAASKPHLLLQCPKDGGILYLETVVLFTALYHQADLISIDAQDIAEVAGDHAEDLPDFPANSVRSLGYDTHLMMATRDQQSTEEDVTEEGDEGEADDVERPSWGRLLPGLYRKAKINVMPAFTFSELLGSRSTNSPPTLFDRLSARANQTSSRSSQSPDVSNNARVDLLLEAFLDAAQAKRRTQHKPVLSNDADGVTTGPSLSPDTEVSSERGGSNASPEKSPTPLIVLINDYAEMNATPTGGPILDRLSEIVRRRRKDGQRILVIGTTSSQNLVPSFSKSGFKKIQTEPGQGPYRVIITPCEPPSASGTGGILERENMARTYRINIRHLQDMIRRLAPSLQRVRDFVSKPARIVELDFRAVYVSDLQTETWSFGRVHRTAMTVLGVLKEDEELSAYHVTTALRRLESSDNAKFDWLRRQKEVEKKLADRGAERPIDPTSGKIQAQKDIEGRIKKLQKSCNTYERKLLNGVVDAPSIHTTFAEVHALPETIEALKNLTSLSLLRPEAFTYGVLATDKIPGLLLYGPPGTGKTLLAKAVAKESGATVLEVSGSDVYDMYVGQSEKNVKAIFSLARKLAPCIVFIDEADAIFGTRDTTHKRTSHREIINQFLREWDGMNDSSAFIMVATNRPFDLDDAVLRRLPRRLLVDLPTEKDREAILGIHLKQELLDPSVSLADLASQTPFYSGSDLKNLSVAAALVCVREENDAAKAHSGPTPYEYAPQRTLTLRHFEKAMDEISASISEDMSSLSAIRKFDEKYGDRKGRRKRSAGYGFGTRTQAEKNNTDLVRVRA